MPTLPSLAALQDFVIPTFGASSYDKVSMTTQLSGFIFNIYHIVIRKEQIPKSWTISPSFTRWVTVSHSLMCKNIHLGHGQVITSYSVLCDVIIHPWPDFHPLPHTNPTFSISNPGQVWNALWVLTVVSWPHDPCTYPTAAPCHSQSWAVKSTPQSCAANWGPIWGTLSNWTAIAVKQPALRDDHTQLLLRVMMQASLQAGKLIKFTHVLYDADLIGHLTSAQCVIEADHSGRHYFNTLRPGENGCHFQTYFLERGLQYLSLLFIYIILLEYTSIGTGWVNSLTHWGRDKMAAVSQKTLSNIFSWMKMLEFRLRFHLSLFLRVQLTIIQHWFR